MLLRVGRKVGTSKNVQMHNFLSRWLADTPEEPLVESPGIHVPRLRILSGWCRQRQQFAPALGDPGSIKMAGDGWASALGWLSWAEDKS